MNPKNSIEKLKYVLTNKTPSLLLGAGFSYGVKNQKNQPLPNGERLAEIIFQTFYGKKPPVSAEQIARAEGCRNDLNAICTLLRTEGKERLAARNKLLTELFTVNKITPLDYHRYLLDYPWKKIYTLNIDNYVERLFQHHNMPLIVWTAEKQVDSTDDSVPILAKLHGDVKGQDANYIFDEIEYNRFISDENYLLRDFGDSAINNDMILLGTEYQENDLKIVIEKYKISGYANTHDFFFISPEIHDVILQSEIENNPRYHWIKWKTEDFLFFLKSKISHNDDCINQLKEKGMLFIEEDAHKGSVHYMSTIYTGVESRYADFWQAWNIPYPHENEWLQTILTCQYPLIFCIHGKSYTGKTCVARSILVQLSQKGYIAREFMVKNSSSVESILKYLELLPVHSKFALLCDNAAYNYFFISDLIKKIPDNISQCVIITVDITANHKRKKFTIDYSYVEEREVKETINRKYAESIIETLDRKSWISSLKKYCSDKSEYIPFIKKTNDIIEFLYLLTKGRGFEQYFEDIMIKKESANLKDRFIALIILGRLGIQYLPLRVFDNMFVKSPQIIIKDFLDEYGDFVSITTDKKLKIRCLRVFEKNDRLTLSTEDTIALLYRVVGQTVNMFTENTYNEYSEIFQKVLLVKQLLDKHILSITGVRVCFDRIEEMCKQYSYYWIQRGLVEQKASAFEQAENYFMQAKEIRPSSYQVRHAIAKNYMERGLYEAKKGNSQAVEYFEYGANMMQDLVENPQYSKAYSYSIHALSNMKFKFSEESNYIIPEDECEYLRDRLSRSNPDAFQLQMLTKLKAYCKKNEYLSVAIRIPTDVEGSYLDFDADEYLLM